LKKKETLDEAELRLVREAPVLSYVLNVAYWGDANNLCANIALNQHEDRVGNGYPQGTKTNSLILDVLFLLDHFDALISERPFRFKKFSIREAIDFVQKDAGEGKLETDVVRAFAALIRQEKIKDLKKINLGTIGRKD